MFWNCEMIEFWGVHNTCTILYLKEKRPMSSAMKLKTFNHVNIDK